MSVRTNLLRYIHILTKLRKAPASFKEIDNYLRRQSDLQGEKLDVSKRHFRRTLDDIESIFEIEVKYDASRDQYFIVDEYQSDVSQRRLEAFDTFSVLKIGESASEHIHFEKRRPLGTEHFFVLLNAIKAHLQLTFYYQKFKDEAGEIRTVQPYALKEFRNRWYLLSLDLKDEKMKTFGLDRLSDIHLTGQSFCRSDKFNVDDFFRNSFGIISPNNKQIETVILSFNVHQGRYIKSLPLHESQEILVDSSEELRVKLNIYISYDFLLEMLSHGETVKVISPKKLVDTIIEMHRRAIEQY